MKTLPWPSVAEPTTADIEEARGLVIAARHTAEVISKLIARGLSPTDSLAVLAETHKKLAARIGRKHLWSVTFNGRTLTEVIARDEQEAREKANTVTQAICSTMGIVQYQAWLPHAEYRDLGELKG